MSSLVCHQNSYSLHSLLQSAILAVGGSLLPMKNREQWTLGTPVLRLAACIFIPSVQASHTSSTYDVSAWPSLYLVLLGKAGIPSPERALLSHMVLFLPLFQPDVDLSESCHMETSIILPFMFGFKVFKKQMDKLITRNKLWTRS